MVPADVIKMGETVPKDMQPIIRIQMKDYPKSRMPELLPFPGRNSVNSDDGSLNDYGKYGTEQGMVDALMGGKILPFNDKPCSKTGKTTQELIDEDGNIIILALKEYDELV